MRVIPAVLFVLSLSLFARGQTHELDSLKRRLYSLPQDTSLIHYGIQISEKLISLGNFAEADSSVTFIRQQSEQQSYPYGLAKCLMLEGMIQYRTNKLHEALVSFQKSLALFEDINLTEPLGKVYSWMANVYYSQSNYELALNYHLKALTNRETFHDQRGIGQSLHNIALIYNDQKDYEKALEFHERSLNIKQELNDKRGIAHSYNNMALIYSNLNQLDLAQEYFSESLKLFKEIKFDLGVAYSMGNLGEVYEKKKEYTQAIETLQQAVNLLTKTGDKKAMAEAYNHLASVHTSIKDYKAAKRDLQQAQFLALEVGAKNELILNYLAYSVLDHEEGNVSSSFNWFKKHSALKDSVFNTEKSNTIARMQTNFDSEKKDQQISLLKAEKELEQTQKESQFVLSGIVVTSLILISLALAYIIFQKQKTNRILQTQKEYSDDLNHLKDKLFSIISHDLRSPLNSLQGLMYLVERNILTEAELKSNLGELGKSTRSMSGLIDNLLHWAKSNLNREIIEKQNFDIAGLVNKNINLFHQQAFEKHIVINSTRVPEKQIAKGDENMIDLVIRNLLSNAIKFTKEHGLVSFSLEQDQEKITLAIEDTGIGISQDRIEKLFSLQSNSTRGTNNEMGTGLGLLLCKDFIEKNDGRIWAHTKPERGSTFYFTLPAI